MSLSCALAVLVRNEVIGSRAMYDRIPWQDFDEVLVVDGHSNDGTREFYEEKGRRVILQSRPGLGAAMLDARAHCTASALVFFHPDGNENPSDLPVIRKYLAEGHDFVVASRMISGAVNEDDERVIRLRKWANIGFAMIANLFWGRKGNRTTDVTNGLRGIRCESWDRMQLDSTDCTMDYQMIIRALKCGIKITEFPTEEGPRIGGSTNFASFDTGLKELKLIVRELVRK